jgi:cyclopropane fatty-acyl-phospholipid synthase-like methyltransferase
VREALAPQLVAGAIVLEIGCGPGSLIAQLASEHGDTRFVGVDADTRMIDHATAEHVRENVDFELADFTEKRPNVVADCAYSIDVLHHVHDLAAFLHGVHEALRPGAVWVAIEPNVFHPYIYWSQERMRRRGLDEDHFRPWVVQPKFRDAGFAVRDRRYAFLFPGFVQHVPKGLERLESALERFRLVGGSVVYQLERDP